MKIGAIVLAGGLGTRMKSKMPKPLFDILGKPMVWYPINAALGAVDGEVVLVSGEHLEQIKNYLLGLGIDDRVVYAVQEQPLGTADAVRAGMARISDSTTHILILNADTPCITTETLNALSDMLRHGSYDLIVSAFKTDNPGELGRVLVDDSGNVLEICEHYDLLDDDEAIDLINAGIYLCTRELTTQFLKQVKPHPIKGEYLLTDIAAYACKLQKRVALFMFDSHLEAIGVNTRAELAEAIALLRRKRNLELMRSGVTMTQPELVLVEQECEIGRDTVLEGHVILRGKTRIGKNCFVGTGCWIVDTIVQDEVHILPYCVIENSRIGSGCQVGPFCHLRPGTLLEEKAKLGNFVETKKAHIGAGSKANHLSYLGDCTIGKGVNVGAGTITCNYDGMNKHHTILEDGVFVGSDSQFVAPVRVGKGAVVAAGTTVTRDVPSGALAISRTPQKNVEGYVEKKKQMQTEEDSQD